ncbi:MAG: DNA polymerase II large subunit [Candidatus Methanomethylicota archaeon]|uniref:DNA polymerase II large subunit n=1 Tax=Thermoproteota archaeon TaxID=2056631 RepID=A0A497F7D2_9CREN|nr:MAG: DNA polymerase II large subunit [Candidatus Verstraetearchaeota archaeon]
MIELSEEMQAYFRELEEEVNRIYEKAKRAREKSFDPTPEPEIFLAKDLAERVEGLLKSYGIVGIAERIRELCKEFKREIVALKIAEEIVYGKFGTFPEEVAAELAIRAALAILTEGITAAPLQGIEKVKIKRNNDGSKYLSIYYAGPIRSAGGTEQALTVLVGDYVRQLLHLERYKPTDEEVKRFIEEIRLYERHVGRFQYHNSDEELEKALKRIPVEITGVATTPLEVSIHRDLPRVETNRIRGGACRVINDGVIGKAAKIRKIAEEVGLVGWDWLREFMKEEGEEESSIKPSEKYLTDVVAGRPIFSHPSRVGGFRLRYGRSRNTGLAALGIHPATMVVLGGFLAVGTQVRTERPGKSGVIMPVSSIEGPIVRLNDGSVVKIEYLSQVEELEDKIEEILFLGDILVAFGEFLENNHPLLPSGYVEEWWVQEVQKAISEKFGGDLEKAAEHIKISKEKLQRLLTLWWQEKPNAEEALAISTTLGIPLHPRFTYHWSGISAGDVQLLKKWIEKTTRTGRGIIGPAEEDVKRILEHLGVPHKLENNDKMALEEDHGLILMNCLAGEDKTIISAENGLEAVNMISNVKIRNKAPTYIGLRMGRPEKAKERKMKPPVHVLFPVGLEGGSSRNIMEASSKRYAKVKISERICPKCKKRTFYIRCPYCLSSTIPIMICPKCGKETFNAKCPICKQPTLPYKEKNIDIYSELKRACINLKIQTPPKLIKGVKGLTNAERTPEPIEKGILRARHGVYVYKDGTIRFDITNAPLTHFKPREIGVTIDKLKQLGYTKDYLGNPLVHEDQIVELKVQDIIIPLEAAEYLVKVARFIDELLVKFYKEEPYYNVKRKEDLIGHVVIGIAPHTSAGVVGRIIGFTKAKVCFAHPYWHAAKRRNCDGDEDAIILGLDAFLNFSKSYLPEKRGGLMDTPLVVMVTIDPREVDDEVFNMETCSILPLEFYEKSQEYADPKEVGIKIEKVSDRLGKKEQYEGLKYTHPTLSIDLGPKITAYKKLKTMHEKVEAQMKIAEKIRAVDRKDVAERILTHHFLPDLIGNLRAFTTQSLRCVKCSTKYERPPLSGKCRKCGGKLVLTVHRKSIEKYLNSAITLIRKYNLGEYYKQRIELIEKELELLFSGEKDRKQTSLLQFWRSDQDVRSKL